MLFFPYRVDLDLLKIPWLTILVCLVCVWVFGQQVKSARAFQEAEENFCGSLDRVTRMILEQVSVPEHLNQCAGVYSRIRESDDSDRAIAEIAQELGKLNFYEDRESEQKFVRSRLRATYRSYLLRVPLNLTDELDYEPLERRVLNMLTSTVTHGDLLHLGFNLLFFYAFAAAVELIIGFWWFAGTLVISALSTSLAYSSSVADGAADIPTIGLSGVVMAMMALLAVLAPSIRIRCFFWFVIIVKIFRVPALVLVAWYVAGDLLAFEREANSQINYVAHISGAATGAMLGAGFWLFARKRLNRILSSM